MHEHLKFTWSVFWRWFVISFIPNFAGELISRGLMHKPWIQMPLGFLTLLITLNWFLKTETMGGRKHHATLNSNSHVETPRSFVLHFTWDIFWRWYMVVFIIQTAFALFFPWDSFAMISVQLIAPIPALFAAVFWARKVAQNFDVPSKMS